MSSPPGDQAGSDSSAVMSEIRRAFEPSASHRCRCHPPGRRRSCSRRETTSDACRCPWYPSAASYRFRPRSSRRCRRSRSARSRTRSARRPRTRRARSGRTVAFSSVGSPSGSVSRRCASTVGRHHEDRVVAVAAADECDVRARGSSPAAARGRRQRRDSRRAAPTSRRRIVVRRRKGAGRLVRERLDAEVAALEVGIASRARSPSSRPRCCRRS